MVQERTHGILGTVRVESSPDLWPLKDIAAKTLIAPRVLLAAEAAHAFSPVGAQGLNLSLTDIAMLADILLEAARAGEDIGSPSVLRRYEGARKNDIAVRMAGVRTLAHVATGTSPIVGGLRRSTLNTLQSTPFLKSLLMNAGMGLNQARQRASEGERRARG